VVRWLVTRAGGALVVVAVSSCARHEIVTDAAIDTRTSDAPGITISGTVTSNSANPIPGATVALLRPDLQQIAIDTASASSASYALAVTNPPSDAFLDVSDGGYEDTYQYFATPLVADVDVTAILFLKSTIDAFATAAGVTQNPSNGFAFVEVRDANDNAVAGAIVTVGSKPATYFGTGGNVDPAATATDASGFAVGFDVTAGTAVHVVASAQLGMAMRDVHVLGGQVTLVALQLH
jgi:hypothetical protein